MRSRKKTRQTAQTAANARGTAGDEEQATETASSSEAPEQVQASEPAAHVAEPVPAADAQINAFDGGGVDTFDAAVEGPEGQVSEGSTSDTAAAEQAEAARSEIAEGALDPKALFALLRQRVLDNPSDYKARVRLGRLHDKRSEPLLALEQYQAAVSAADDRSDVVLQFAQALTNLNRFAEAERELRRVLRVEPDN